MSVDWLSTAWVTDTGSPAKKSVLIALADRCGEDGICWPSYRDLVERTELSKATVRRAVEELQIDGLIRAWDRARPDGSDTSKGYKLLIGRNSGRGAHSEHGGAQAEHGGVLTVSTRTEPSFEPSSAVVPKGTATTSGRRAKRSFGQPAEDDESPNLGVDPDARREPPAKRVRPPRDAGRTPAMPERIDTQTLTPAAEAADTPHRCALRFKQLNIKNKKIAPANVMEFTATLKRWYAEGLDLDVLRTMIDIFAARPESYMTGRQDIPWRAFINAREKLHADATKVSEARDPAAKFGTAYARAAAR